MMCDRSRRDPSPSSALSRYDKRRSSFLISWLLRLRETEHGANGLWNAVERDREGRQEGMASPLLLAAVIDQHARDPTVLQGSPKQCTAWAWPCAVNCERRRRSIHAAFDAGLRMRTPFFNGETTGREALNFFIGDGYPEALNFFWRPILLESSLNWLCRAEMPAAYWAGHSLRLNSGSLNPLFSPHHHTTPCLPISPPPVRLAISPPPPWLSPRGGASPPACHTTSPAASTPLSRTSFLPTTSTPTPLPPPPPCRSLGPNRRSNPHHRSPPRFLGRRDPGPWPPSPSLSLSTSRPTATPPPRPPTRRSWRTPPPRPLCRSCSPMGWRQLPRPSPRRRCRTPGRSLPPRPNHFHPSRRCSTCWTPFNPSPASTGMVWYAFGPSRGFCFGFVSCVM